MSITILSVFPELLDLNGDAQNALVLAQRARWAGLDARVHALPLGASPSGRPDIVVVGSGAESSARAVLDGLRALEDDLRSWTAASVPLLAVGTGWELLGESVELATGPVLTGLGVFSGRSIPRARVSDDLVVDTAYGRLVGFENHARQYLAGTGAQALGTVVYGVGNSGSPSVTGEGEIVGASFGTHLHGPVLAKNPGLADHLLSLVDDGYGADNATARRVDASAEAARTQILLRLGLAPQ